MDGGKCLAKEIHNLILKVWKQEQIPEGWTQAIIIPIHNKRSRKVCENYRVNSLLPTVYKIFSYSLLNHLSPYVGENIAEYWFKEGKADQIFNIR